MYREINFPTNPEEKDKILFEFLYHGFIIGGHLTQEKGLRVLKTELAILDAFDVISKTCDCGRLVSGTKEEDRELVGGSLKLHNMEWELLEAYVSKVPWSTGISVRRALTAIEAIKNATPLSN